MGIARDDVRQLIRRTIVRNGHHVYAIMAGTSPRFAYTVGLTESIRAELVLAGAATYGTDDVHAITNAIASALRVRASYDPPFESTFSVDGLGSFTLRKADRTWSRLLLCCAAAYYRFDVHAYQIVPDGEHSTVDIPDMSAPWSATAAPAWRYLCEPWPHRIPESAHVATCLDVLRGADVMRAARRTNDYWEMFSMRPLREEDVRVVPVATLLAADETLGDLLALPIGAQRWRNGRAHPWLDYM
jgi:hypothetical protein